MSVKVNFIANKCRDAVGNDLNTHYIKHQVLSILYLMNTSFNKK